MTQRFKRTDGTMGRAHDIQSLIFENVFTREGTDTPLVNRALKRGEVLAEIVAKMARLMPEETQVALAASMGYTPMVEPQSANRQPTHIRAGMGEVVTGMGPDPQVKVMLVMENGTYKEAYSSLPAFVTLINNDKLVELYPAVHRSMLDSARAEVSNFMPYQMHSRLGDNAFTTCLINVHQQPLAPQPPAPVNTVAVVVSGGVVQSIRASRPDIRIELVDCDNLHGEGRGETEIEQIIAEAGKNCPFELPME